MYGILHRESNDDIARYHIHHPSKDGLYARQEHELFQRDVWLVLVGRGFSKVVWHVCQASAEVPDIVDI